MPPPELHYPDLRNDEDFFEKIGCPHLKFKYLCPDEEEDLEDEFFLKPVERKSQKLLDLKKRMFGRVSKKVVEKK